LKMEKKKYTGKHAGKKKSSSKLVIVLASIVILLLVLIIGMMLIVSLRRNERPVETTVPTMTTAATEMTTEATTAPTEETTEPTEEQLPILDKLAALHDQNPDIAGWIKMEGTKLDDPVMYTPDDEQKYIYADFDGKFDPAGLPFIDTECSLDPESKNVIIYGHNMFSGKMFAAIMKYETKDFWTKYPTFKYSTLYEEREYEVFAAFYDKIYENPSEDQFEFYYFIDPASEEAFNEGIQYFKEKSKYDTGITPTYDDQLLMLVTCAYNTQDGRFVVVAREKTAE